MRGIFAALGSAPPPGAPSRPVRLARLLEVAGLADRELRRIDVALERVLHFLRRERGDATLEIHVPGKGAVYEQVHVQPRGEGAILRARQTPRFQQATLGGFHFLRAEAIVDGARELFAYRLLDARLVLRREDRRDIEARGLVELAGHEPAVGAVGEAFL